jgi:hypothetical protein
MNKKLLDELIPDNSGNFVFGYTININSESIYKDEEDGGIFKDKDMGRSPIPQGYDRLLFPELFSIKKCNYKDTIYPWEIDQKSFYFRV